ncbi:hypothetical protein [Nonomuraea zeae]|uniref:hypothetical protein n=1 Tax=Nonomuraea zeae TaxID=1642303 RepID=UPI00197FBC4D|nr:hypothetical protein [Nonomuraea zeae]
MKAHSPPAIAETGARIFAGHRRPVVRGKVLRRVGVAALAAALLAATATPAVAAAESGGAVRKAAAGQDRPELQQAIQAFVDAGFAGVQLRVHDERREWAGSAGVRELGQSAKLNHNGSVNGYAALMYSSPDGKKTMTASITTGDAANNPAQDFPKMLDGLIKAVFCGGQTGPAR